MKFDDVDEKITFDDGEKVVRMVGTTLPERLVSVFFLSEGIAGILLSLATYCVQYFKRGYVMSAVGAMVCS